MHSVIETTQAQLDTAQQQIRQQQLQISSLQKKNSRLEQSGGTSELHEEIANYRQLTMCSACTNSFKTHLLMKCMHTFWYFFLISFQCIDDMVQSRQRKCPSCGISFGKEDIRQFYL